LPLFISKLCGRWAGKIQKGTAREQQEGLDLEDPVLRLVMFHKVASPTTGLEA